MKAIFLPTIQHTGTWFTINLLLYHSKVNSFSELRNLKFGEDITIIHTHFGDGETRHPLDECKHQPFYVVKELIKDYPCVIPLRDPLAALVTRQVRHSDLQHSYIIEGFVALAEFYKENPKIYFLPVDVIGKKSFEEKLLALRQVLKFLELPEESYIKFIAAGWPLVNSTAGMENELHEHYKTSNIEKIKEIIPEEWAYLKGKESILKPFLKTLGYKNLLWWEQ